MSLSAFTIAFGGAHTVHPDFKNKKISDLKNSMSACGGTYSTKVTTECTHLVVSQEQYSKNLAKVKEASDLPEILIVTFDWLVESFAQSSKVDEAPYLLNLGQSTSTQAKPNASAANTDQSHIDKKRRRPDSSDGDGDPVSHPQSKKPKAQANGLKPGNLSTSTSFNKDNKDLKSKPLNIPVDEGCDLAGRAKVYCDDDGAIHDVTLNQTNAGHNNNKFYRIQLLIDHKGAFHTWTRWGRVGESGQSKMLSNGGLDFAFREFQKKFRDKSGNTWDNRDQPAKSGKYTYVERNYEESEDDGDDLPGAGKRRGSKESLGSMSSGISPTVESKLPIPVQQLMKIIFNQDYMQQTMRDLDYDAGKMPLGKLSKRTLIQGYEVLKTLAGMIGSGSTVRPDIELNSNRYFSLIPHDFGRNRPPVLENMTMIKKEIEVLEALTDLQLTNEIMKEAKGQRKTEKEEVNILDLQYQKLGMQEMTPLSTTSHEFKELQEYLIQSAGGSHHIRYKVQDIFRIERTGEGDRFGQSPYATIKNSDRRLLWHGSRCTNFGGILSQGLRIAPPEAPVSGYMFGKGVYLADISTKSANYTASYTSANIGLLLLCEAELGKPALKLINADYEADVKAKKSACISTLGVGQTAPKAWKDAGIVNPNLKGVLMPDVSIAPGPSAEDNAGLLYNEYIVYDVAQIRLRYLLRVEIR